jgi:hypothetical protein
MPRLDPIQPGNPDARPHKRRTVVDVVRGTGDGDAENLASFGVTNDVQNHMKELWLRE